MSFVTWEDATDAAIAAWLESVKDLPRYNGSGNQFHVSIGRAVVRSSAWDGSIVARLSLHDWQQSAECEWSRPHRRGVDGDRRFVDYSDMLPQSSRTLRLFADARVPPGWALVETPEGRLLAVVQW